MDPGGAGEPLGSVATDMNRSARHGSSATGRQQVWTGRSGSPVGDGKAGGPAAGGVQGELYRGAQDGDAGPGPPQLHQDRSERLLEGVLRKYTNLLQGWQNRLGCSFALSLIGL